MKHRSGLADSPFFSPPLTPEPESTTPVAPALTNTTDTTPPSNHDTEVSSNHGIVIPRYQQSTIENIRRAVKEFGKEAATHRFTLTEKRAIANIVHSLNMQGIRTTENEVTRIAINYVIDEFNQQEKDSLLGLVIKALKQ